MTDEELIQKTVEREDFDPFEGKAFRVRLDDGVDLSLILDAVEALPANKTSKPNIRKHPFSLLFTGPTDLPLADALHHLTRDDGEPFILYLDKKDSDPDTGQILYEAIIN